MNKINRSHKAVATDWLLRELQAGPVWCEGVILFLEHTRGVQCEATRAAIKDLLKQGTIRVRETARYDGCEYQRLELATP